MAKIKKQKREYSISLSAIISVLVVGAALFLVALRLTFGSREDGSAGLPYSILIVAGQSNAAGAESLVSDPDHNIDVFGAQSVLPADSQVQMLYDDGLGNNSLNKGNLVPLNTLQQPNVSTPAIFGPEVGLSRELYNGGRRRTIILKVAAGGNPLAQDPSTSFDWNVHSTNEMYKILKDRYNLLKGILDNQGARYNLDGFYWVQGEADTTESFAPLYEQNLKDLFDQVKLDFPVTDKTQFVIGKTSNKASVQFTYAFNGDGGCAPYTCSQKLAFNDQVRAAQQAVADSYPNTSIVDTEPLEHTGFKVHLSNLGQLELGRLFALATEGSVDKKLPAQQESIFKNVEEWQRVYNPNLANDPIARDGGSSVRLGDHILWMFGDTFYSMHNEDNNHHSRSSTAAIAPIEDPYNLSEPVDANGAPYQFIPYNEQEKAYNDVTTDPADRYINWPSIAINTSPTEAIVYYSHIKSGGSDARDIGVGIARVREGETVATVLDEQLFAPTEPYKPAILHDGIIYLRYCKGIHLNFDQICATGRVRLEDYADRSKYEFWDGSDWQLDSASATFDAPGRGTTVIWSEYLKKYLLISTRAFSGSMTVRTADRVQGPWSDAEYVYSVTGAKYAAIFYPHPELDSPDGKTLAFSAVKQQTVVHKASDIYTFKLNLEDLATSGSTGGGNGDGSVGSDSGGIDGLISRILAPRTGILSADTLGWSLVVGAVGILGYQAYKNIDRKKHGNK